MTDIERRKTAREKVPTYGRIRVREKEKKLLSTCVSLLRILQGLIDLAYINAVILVKFWQCMCPQFHVVANRPYIL